MIAFPYLLPAIMCEAFIGQLLLESALNLQQHDQNESGKELWDS